MFLGNEKSSKHGSFLQLCLWLRSRSSGYLGKLVNIWFRQSWTADVVKYFDHSSKVDTNIYMYLTSGSIPNSSRKIPIGVFFPKPRVSATLVTCRRCKSKTLKKHICGKFLEINVFFIFVIRMELLYWFLPLKALPQRNGAFYIDCVRQKLWPTSKRSFLLLQEPYISAYILLQNNHATYKSKLGILDKYVKKLFKKYILWIWDRRTTFDLGASPMQRIVIGWHRVWWFGLSIDVLANLGLAVLKRNLVKTTINNPKVGSGSSMSVLENNWP